MKINKLQKQIEILQELIEMEQMKNNKIYELHEMLEKKERWKKNKLTNQAWKKILNNTTRTKQEIIMELLNNI